MVTKESPPATKESPPATKESPPATKESPPATKESPPATKESPFRDEGVAPPATKESPPYNATKESPPVDEGVAPRDGIQSINVSPPVVIPAHAATSHINVSPHGDSDRFITLGSGMRRNDDALPGNP